MKHLFKAALVAAGIFSFGAASAQTHKDSTVGQKIDKTATKVGHKTAQIAATGAAAVTDKKYDGKRGPHGEAIYINKHSHYFYVNKKGKRVYLKKSQLLDEPKD